MFWAHLRAKNRVYSNNLGLDPLQFSIFWYGKRGMVWENLMSVIGRLLQRFPPPDVLIIHLGGTI